MQSVIGHVRVVNLDNWNEIFKNEIWPSLQENGAQNVKSYCDKNDIHHISYFFEVSDMKVFLRYIDTPEAWRLFVKYGAYPIEVLTEQRGAA